MILLTRLNGSKFYINADLIQLVDITPDTVITLVDKNKFVVQEPAEIVVQRFIEYRQKTSRMEWFIRSQDDHSEK
jgi:flagellar protein FlbD